MSHTFHSSLCSLIFFSRTSYSPILIFSTLRSNIITISPLYPFFAISTFLTISMFTSILSFFITFYNLLLTSPFSISTLLITMFSSFSLSFFVLVSFLFLSFSFLSHLPLLPLFFPFSFFLLLSLISLISLILPIFIFYQSLYKRLTYITYKVLET